MLPLIKLLAFELRSRFKAKYLGYKEPLKTLKDIAKKSYERNIVGDDFWSLMSDGSNRSNRNVDAKYNLDKAHHHHHHHHHHQQQPRFK